MGMHVITEVEELRTQHSHMAASIEALERSANCTSFANSYACQSNKASTMRSSQALRKSCVGTPDLFNISFGDGFASPYKVRSIASPCRSRKIDACALASESLCPAASPLGPRPGVRADAVSPSQAIIVIPADNS